MAGGLAAKIPVVTLVALQKTLRKQGVEFGEDSVQGRKFTVTWEKKERGFTLLLLDGAFVVARDGRDTFKKDAWELTAKSGTLAMEEEISPGDGSPYYLAGWILNEAQAPAQLLSAESEKATQLQGLVAKIFARSVVLTKAWRGEAATHLDKAPNEPKVTARVRGSLAACCYEALKQARSWVELDKQAADERASREQVFISALEKIEKPLRAPVRNLLEAIDERADQQRSIDGDATPLHPGSLTWKSCESIRNFLDTGVLSYRRDDEDHAWSHPDWAGFWEDFGEPKMRPAMTALVSVVPPADDERPSIGELHRAWYRAQGYARLTVTDHVRLHVDRSNAGTRGTLESTVDPTDPQRARGARGHLPTEVVLGSVEWLGKSHPLRFHAGRNRSLTIVDEDGGWQMSFLRNVRRPEQMMKGVCKAFDLSLREDCVRIDLPVQVPMPTFADTAQAKSLSIGGWYRMRPGTDPSSPAKAIQPLLEGRVLGLDIGVVPVGGYAVIERADETFREIASGLLGDLGDIDPVIFVPGVHLRAVATQIEIAVGLRAYLKSCTAAVAEDEPHPAIPSRLARRADPDLLAAAQRCVEFVDWKRVQMAVPAVMSQLITAIAQAAAGPVTTGHEVLMGMHRVAGRGKAADDHAKLVQGLLKSVIDNEVSDPDVRQVLRALLFPLVTLLLAYQRSRACRADLGTVSKKSGITDAVMCQRRDAIAKRHGFAHEAAYWSIVHLGATQEKSLARASDQEHDRALTIRNLLADLWERTASLGQSLSGWGSAPLARGEKPSERDPRRPWDDAYGFLRTMASNIRQAAHEGLACRAVALAKQHGCVALAIERLDLEMSSRSDRESNGLSRRMAAKEWTAMVMRAADLAGLTLVLVDAWWSSSEVAPLQTASGLAPRNLAIRQGRDLYTTDGKRLALSVRVNAARNIALRSLAGYPQRVRFSVMQHGSTAVLIRPGTDGKGPWGVWQDRLAQDLGRVSAQDIWWTINSAGQATLGEGAVSPVGAGAKTVLVGIGAKSGQPRWLTTKAFATCEGVLQKRLQKESAAAAG